jgi:hypothetical protein
MGLTAAAGFQQGCLTKGKEENINFFKLEQSDKRGNNSQQ